MFDFDFIFSEHEEEFILYTRTEGEYDERGRWIKGTESELEKAGMIQTLSNDDLKYSEEGVYTTRDIKIYSQESLPTKVKMKRLSNNREYYIQEERDHNNPGNYFLYWARGVEK